MASVKALAVPKVLLSLPVLEVQIAQPLVCLACKPALIATPTPAVALE